MSNDKIQKLLASLHAEVKKTGIDDETRSSLKQLDADIHDLLDASKPESDVDFVMDRAKQLEADFAVRHPTVEKVLREVIDTLAHIGI